MEVMGGKQKSIFWLEIFHASECNWAPQCLLNKLYLIKNN